MADKQQQRPGFFEPSARASWLWFNRKQMEAEQGTEPELFAPSSFACFRCAACLRVNKRDMRNYQLLAVYRKQTPMTLAPAWHSNMREPSFETVGCSGCFQDHEVMFLYDCGGCSPHNVNCTHVKKQ